MEPKFCGFLLMVDLFLELTLCANGNPDGCPLLIQPYIVVVKYGDPVSGVNCTISKAHNGIGWEASEGSVDMVEGVQFVTWSVETLTDWEIEPKCFGNYQAEAGDISQCTEKLNIVVYKPPNSVSISIVNHTGPMLEGKQYLLQCEVQNIAPVQYLTVKWYKGGTLQNQTSHHDLTKTPVNVFSTLLITPTSADDGAQYSCVAELELGPEGPQPPPEVKSDHLNITVHYKPRIKCPERGKLREGESLDSLASCRAEGKPFAMVTWYRNQSEFKSSTPLTRRDGGRYTLFAKNGYGTANHTMEIDVLYKPLITKCADLETLREGESLDSLVSCRSEGNPMPMVTWYRNQSKFNSSTPLTRRDGGRYTLLAKNSYGTANHKLEIDVLYEPQITECPEQETLKEGESLDSLVACRAEGNPSPIVTWYRNQSKLNGSTPLTRRDGGRYTLIANNRYGTANHTLEIHVFYKPKITACPYQETLQEGGTLDTLACRAEGNPSPIVTWYRNQSEFNISIPLTRRDDGQYIFMAKNSLGSITWTVNLTITHPPNGSVCLTPVSCILFLGISVMHFLWM